MQFVHLLRKVLVATQFYLSHLQRLVVGVFLQALQPLIFWLLAEVVVLVITVAVAVPVVVFITKQLLLFLELWLSLLEQVAQQELQMATEQMAVNLFLVAQL